MLKRRFLFLTSFLVFIIAQSLNSEIILATFKLNGLTCSECMGPLKRILKERISAIDEIRSIYMKEGLIDASLNAENTLTLDELIASIENAIKTSQNYQFDSLKRAAIQGTPSKEGTQSFLTLSHSKEKILLSKQFTETIEQAIKQKTTLVLFGKLSKVSEQWELSPH